MFRIQIENKISDLGRNQEKELEEKKIIIYDTFTRMEHTCRIGFLVGPHVQFIKLKNCEKMTAETVGWEEN